MKDIGKLPPADKKSAGQKLNVLRQEMERALSDKRRAFSNKEMAGQLEQESIDVTRQALPPKLHGHLHPLTQLEWQIEDFFRSMGFMVLDGPELESEYYNFEVLNIPATHPARDMQDTFFIKDLPGAVMRTHTSPVQVRALEEYGAPIRAIVPGRCFRNEATDTRHEHTFYHIEGLAVGRGISFSHLKGVLEATAKFLYGEDTEVRLRPKYYPFVEPGVNGEVTCFLCRGDGCKVCKKTGWLEIFGAGLMHPNVLKAGGVDPDEHQGFAFGIGLERLAMLKYGIEDIRHFESGDLRFLEQF